MKANSERVREIFNFFGKSRRTKLKRDYLAEFGYHEQTFWNKLNPNSKYIFADDEIMWFERWALSHGMPLKNEETEELTKQSA